MDSEQFDGLVRLMSSGATRRGVVRNLTGAAIGGILVAVGFGEAAARKKKRKKKIKPAGCGIWVLAGATDPNGPDAHIRVDDDLAVSVNGQVVAKDDDGTFTEKAGPFIFSAQAGDQLRIVATDVQAGAHELGPLYLRCAGGGAARKLSDGFPRTQTFPEPAGTFFDETFTI